MELAQRKCRACGSQITQKSYQMRAADEVSTTIWSCDMCPVDESRVRFSDPTVYRHLSYPRAPHNRSFSEPVYSAAAPVQSYTYIELKLSDERRDTQCTDAIDNVRYRRSVAARQGRQRVPAYSYDAGVHAGLTVTVAEARVVSPLCSIYKADVYGPAPRPSLDKLEKDGTVEVTVLQSKYTVYTYSKLEAGKCLRTAVMKVDEHDNMAMHAALVVLHSIRSSWPDIHGFVSKDYLSTINNLSPRAWDSKRLQKKGAVYSPKVDGERAYILVYGGSAHLFSKGRGLRHIGWRVLKETRVLSRPVIIDVENTISYGCFFIDMLTDEHGAFSPKTRDYAWSVSKAMQLVRELGVDFVRFKPHYSSLRQAEDACSLSMYPTDGVIALWKGSTTARKMKQERSIELVVGVSNNLLTFDGDTVIENAPVPSGTEPGDIVEVRFRLAKDGVTVLCEPLFRRIDKANPNSTSAVCSVLESFSCVSRSDETRRRNVTMWCDSLKSNLLRQAINKCDNRKIIMDVGTGTGQSLDALTNDKGVSYILIEPNRDKCEMIKRRAGTSRVWTEPRDILSNIRHLKSGSQIYMVLCCELSAIVADEDLMLSIHTEIGAVTATFSLHFVVAELYELSTYWSLPVVGCFYPYDSVEVGGCLVDSLGVTMKRVSESQCTVRWGRDSEYLEPYTTIPEYQVFSSVRKATELLQAPGPELDKEVFELCNKIYVVH